MGSHPPGCLCDECLKIFEDSGDSRAKSLGASLGSLLGDALVHLVRGARWVWYRGKQPIAADELAQNLYEAFVQEVNVREQVSRFEIPERLVSRFCTKLTLYHEAVILMALISRAKDNPAFLGVLAAYEEIVVGPAPTPGALEKLEALRHAMADLQGLLHDGAELTWSSEWLAEIGHVDHNPARTMLFAMLWTTLYKTTWEAIVRFSVKP